MTSAPAQQLTMRTRRDPLLWVAIAAIAAVYVRALAFTPIDIRLRSADGVEYRGGSAIGMEPTINPRNLNPGERSRGWVWFTVPEGTTASEIVYIAPQPQFRITI